jgi:hypothetical protein
MPNSIGALLRQFLKALLAAASLDFADSLCLGSKDLIASESHETRYAFDQDVFQRFAPRCLIFGPQVKSLSLSPGLPWEHDPPRSSSRSPLRLLVSRSLDLWGRQTATGLAKAP